MFPERIERGATTAAVLVVLHILVEDLAFHGAESEAGTPRSILRGVRVRKLFLQPYVILYLL